MVGNPEFAHADSAQLRSNALTMDGILLVSHIGALSEGQEVLLRIFHAVLILDDTASPLRFP